ncbi:MAG: response regulator [Dehalococcoidia bacterium]
MKDVMQTEKKTDIHIVVANGYDRVIMALSELLELESDLRVVGQSTNGPDTLNILRDSDPDVLVLGLMNSEWDSLNLARQVGDSFPSMSIVFISVYNDGYYRDEAARAGVTEYVAMSEIGARLVPAIRSAAKVSF